MAETTAADREAVRIPSPPDGTIVDLIRAGTLDAELAATLWLLIEGRVPVIVAATDPASGDEVLAAMLGLLPPSIDAIELAGAAERFEWLPQASELGWQRSRPAPDATDRIADPDGADGTDAGAAAAGETVLVAASDGPAIRPDTAALVWRPEAGEDIATWGDVGRIAVRAAAIGYGFGATLRADSLEAVLAALGGAPVSLTEDERSRIGVVLIVQPIGPGGAARVAAAHYVRPVARDEHGHVQRLGPAVLATWDPVHDRFEQFAWGITPELAARIGRRAGDLDLEVDRRRARLVELVASPIVDADAIGAALEAIRPSPVPAAAT